MSSDLIVDIGNCHNLHSNAPPPPRISFTDPFYAVLPQRLFLAIVRYFMSYTASQFYLELTDAHTHPGLTLLVPLEDFEPHRYDEHNESHLMSKLTPPPPPRYFPSSSSDYLCKYIVLTLHRK